MLPARGRALAEPEEYLKSPFRMALMDNDGVLQHPRHTDCRMVQTYAIDKRENKFFSWHIVRSRSHVKRLLTFHLRLTTHPWQTASLRMPWSTSSSCMLHFNVQSCPCWVGPKWTRRNMACLTWEIASLERQALRSPSQPGKLAETQVLIQWFSRCTVFFLCSFWSLVRMLRSYGLGVHLICSTSPHPGHFSCGVELARTVWVSEIDHRRHSSHFRNEHDRFRWVLCSFARNFFYFGSPLPVNLCLELQRMFEHSIIIRLRFSRTNFFTNERSLTPVATALVCFWCTHMHCGAKPRARAWEPCTNGATLEILRWRMSRRSAAAGERSGNMNFQLEEKHERQSF